MVVVFGVLLVCWLTVVAYGERPLWVLLYEKHEVSVRVSIKLPIPIMEVVFIGRTYSQKSL